MEIIIFNTQGKETGRVLMLNKSVFNITPKDYIIHLEIKRYLSAQRQGTHKTKERSEVSGSTRKLQKQKGTGNARKGDIKSPLLKGGGRVFGPRPKIYNFKLNKSFKRLAKCSILSQKFKNNQIKIVEDFSLDSPKTKKLLNFLNFFNFVNKKVLIILDRPNKNLYLSSRNLQGIKVVTVNELNSYDLLNAFYIVFLESSVEKVQQNLKT